mgnify:CR=1 FL=1
MSKNFCSKCGFKLQENVKFCPNCGHQIADHVICETCGKQLHPDTELCPSCNTVINTENQDNQNTSISKEKTLIEKVAEQEKTEDKEIAAEEEKTDLDVEIDSTNDYAVENQTVMPGENKHKVLVNRGRIEVARMAMFVMGIILIIQNIMLMGLFIRGKNARAASNISYNQNSIILNMRKYRGFTEKEYEGPENQYSKRMFPKKKPNENLPRIPSATYKILMLVVILGLFQGVGFIFLSSYVKKNAFVAILIAFVFELTYGLLKVASAIYRAVNNVNIDYSQLNKYLDKEDISFLLNLQVVLLFAVSAVLVIFLARGLKSSIELRKMEHK